MFERLANPVAVLALVMCTAMSALAQDAAVPASASCETAPLTIARMQWPSAAILAHIHTLVLREAYGCEVEVVQGDLSATTSSMATTGQPSIAPELWSTRVASIWNPALENQAVRRAGPSYEGGAFEGWFVPDFVMASHPELTSAIDLRDYWQVFRTGSSGPATFVSCPPDWACAIINRNLLKALELDTLFEVVEPANRFELDTLIADAMSSRRPILFYYWQPNAVLAQFDFTQLEMPGFDAEAASCLARRDCADPEPSAFAEDSVIMAAVDELFVNQPEIAAYLARAQMPLSEMNALLAWQSEQSAEVEDVAAHFIETREEIWRAWVSEDIFEQGQ